MSEMMWLAMQTVDGTERRFELAPPRVVLGRDSRCDLRVAIPTVSSRHCEITLDGRTVTVRDLESGTGTFHNGDRVTEARMTADDRLTIGPVTFVLRVDPATEQPSTVAEMKPRPADSPATAPSRR